jgi:Lrp/AsnC family transcriptional regulator for asnA, asnC and gidA
MTTRAEIAKRLFEVAAVDYVVTTLGSFDLLVEVVCRDDRELGETIDRSIRSIEGITGIEVFPYFDLHYQQPAWDRAGKKESDRAAERQVRLDAVDQGIIRFLSDDGRMPFLELARQLGVSEGQIRKRFGRLTQEGTIQVLAITNPRSIGYDVTAWICVTIEGDSSMREVADKLVAIPTVSYLATCGGRFDIMMEVVCRDKADLYTLVDATLRTVPGIASAQTLLCDEFLYRRLVPIDCNPS